MESFTFDLTDDSLDIGYEERQNEDEVITRDNSDLADFEELSPLSVTVSDTEPLAALKLFEEDIYMDSSVKSR